MRLLSLECRDFRCLECLRFLPAPGVNIIRGENAQGKTTLLEALLFAATSKSHRTAAEPELARHGAPGFSVRLKVARRDREVALDAFWHEGAKRFRINGAPQQRVSDILGKVHVVFFCPEDVELVKGGASARRRFLDMELSQLSPGYLAALQQYRAVLRQRNELLRGYRPDPDLLEVWDAQLGAHGALLMQERAAYAGELAELAHAAYADIAGGESLELRYEPDIDGPGEILAQLKRVRASDLKRGMTTRGPHRDDLEIRIDAKGARQFASQGQQKSAAIALKVAEARLIRQRVGEWPILMLDEVLAELDDSRARRLFAAVDPEVQCLVTTTELDGRPDRFGADWTSHRMHRGAITQE